MDGFFAQPSPMTQTKYRVLKRIDAGGMAEVFVGEATSVQGFKKQVAIKRVLPHLAQNESFIQMFLDEARLSARLNHANIVSVFDISAHEDTYFLIMEFVDGANLKRIAEARHQRGKRMPVGEAAYICMEACRGLSYAHELVDEQGQPLGIVHRDISPPNILVTKRGEVKVADFGLAKAETQLGQTDPGVVKGKFSYLSPEAASGLEVDARSDIFSLGVVLWEMLAGRRLFLGDSDYATVKLVRNASIPRLAPLNREVDEAFEDVLLRALCADREQRYSSAQEFGDALAGYLFGRQMKVTSYDIASLVTEATSSVLPPPKHDDPSRMDRLIQDELNEAVVIESQAPRAPDRLRASSPPGGLEDPASWFSDEEFGSGLSSRPPGALAAVRGDLSTTEGRKRKGSGRWRESAKASASGVPFADEDLTNDLELQTATSHPPAPQPAAGAPPPPPPAAPGPPPPPSAANLGGAVSDGNAAPASADPASADKAGGPRNRMLLAAVVALLIGAGIAFGVVVR